jgi:broad specificity phosphatase PhoE
VEALRLLVVRHGGTEWTGQRRFTGSRDLPLSEAGVARGEAVASALAGRSLEAIYASPLERARTTAELIAKPHRLDVRVSAAFRDVAFGAWEGLTADAVARGFPEAWTRWGDTPDTVPDHGGESISDVASRVAGGIAGLQQAHAGRTVAVVTHAIPVRLVVLAALGLGLDRLWSVDASPAGITELEYAREWVTVHRMNTLAHLSAGAAPAMDGPRPGFPGTGDEVTP